MNLTNNMRSTHGRFYAAAEGVNVRGLQLPLTGPPIALQCLILGDFADALRLLVTNLDGRNLVTTGNT